MVTPVLLYVEDEENDVFFMERAFKRNNARLILQAVPDGHTAIAYLGGAGQYSDRNRFPLPHVVLLDINLPGFSGFEVLAWLRKQPHLALVPAVMFSSSARPEDKDKARDLGASAFLEKPMSGLDFPIVAAEFYRHWLENLPHSPGPTCALTANRRP